MPRRRLHRRVAAIPAATFFKPQGTALREIEEVVLPVEGLEALRLADLEGLGTEEAARDMGVSRHTFGRVLAQARQAVARVLVGGLALRIEGGSYRLAGEGPAQPTANDNPQAAAQAGGGVAEEEETMQGQGQGGCGGRGGKGQGGGMGRGQGQGQGQGQGGGQGRGQGQCGGMGRGQGQGCVRGLGPNGQVGRSPVAPAQADGIKALERTCPICGRPASGAVCPACGADLN